MPDPSAWRIDKLKWAATSFDGLGAAKEGGRWNSSGVRIVYCSRHLAMAAQEKFIHLPKPVSAAVRFIKFRIGFGKLAVETVSDLPAEWDLSPPTSQTQKIGDEWATSGRTAILAVPSALIAEETNYLLNPLHPDFKHIVISPHEPFAYEARLARLQEPPPSL